MASTHDYVKDSRNDNIYIYINGDFFFDQKQRYLLWIVGIF